jgi:hypothetical protein
MVPSTIATTTSLTLMRAVQLAHLLRTPVFGTPAQCPSSGRTGLRERAKAG